MKFDPVIITLNHEGENFKLEITACSYDKGVTTFYTKKGKITCKGYFTDFGIDSEFRNPMIAETMSQTSSQFPMIDYKNEFFVRTIF